MDQERNYELHPPTYEWSARLFDSVRHALRVDIRIHHDEHQMRRGEIFLFNHFARFETFIPQYLIFRECGAYCRSVASAEFFKGDERLAGLLERLGVLPNDHPRLLPFLATEVLKGRKVVVFPEGGMVKDRRVVDHNGDYSVYSRKANARRKHHSGAAVLAIGLEVFRARLRAAEAAGDWKTFERWAGLLGFDHAADLHAAVHRPTTIIPANITFYPLRVSDNAISKGIERLAGNLSPRAAEELIIESNILTRDTDMDIRLGRPLQPGLSWRGWDRISARALGARAEDFDGLFSLRSFGDSLPHKAYSFGVRRMVDRLRDRYMAAMYDVITANVSHLASHLLMRLRERNVDSIERGEFARMVYLGVKRLQVADGVHLHRSVLDPDTYCDLPEGRCPTLDQFLANIEQAGLVARGQERMHLLDKIEALHEFDQIRIENPVAVYANESAPIDAVQTAADKAIDDASTVSARELTDLRMDDERRALRRDREAFRGPQHAEINAGETATASPEPTLLLPDQPRPLGVLLSHGLLASPAEVRDFGMKLGAAGYAVFMPRLKGHGTSPWDLHTREWTDWFASVRRGYHILAPHVERICVIGFSTGGALSLLLAAEQPPKLAGAVSIAAPLKFANRNMVFVPLVHGANVLLRSLSPAEGVKLFRANESEHPHINYRNVPIRALYELRQAVDALRDALPRVTCPVRILQGTQDRVVDPSSAQLLHDQLGSSDREVTMIPSQRHGILNEDVGQTHALIERFLERLQAP
ncbi:MAG: alpha/beta fold hydrolase [Gammaproteobacteria bacterium]